MALARIGSETDVPPHGANDTDFPFGAKVLSLETWRDLRSSALAGESDGLNAQLRRNTKRLTLLLDLAREAGSNQELYGLVKAIMTRIKSATDSDGVCLLLANTKPREFDVYALEFKSEASSFKQRTVLPLVGTIANDVLSTGKPWAGTREQACATFQSQLLLNEQFGTASMLPLSGRNGVVGTLGLVRAGHKL